MQPARNSTLNMLTKTYIFLVNYLFRFLHSVVPQRRLLIEYLLELVVVPFEQVMLLSSRKRDSPAARVRCKLVGVIHRFLSPPGSAGKGLPASSR